MSLAKFRISVVTVALLTSLLNLAPSFALQIAATGTNASVCNQEVNTNVGVTAERLANGDCLVQFKSTSSTYLWTAPSRLSKARILIIAGGGGGGAARDNGSGGGGGAGQVKEFMGLNIFAGNTYSISVGSGGIAGIGASSYPIENNAGAGQNSVISIGGSSVATALGGNPGGGSRIVTPGAANSIPSGGGGIGGTPATPSTSSQGGSRGGNLGGGGGGGGSAGNGGTGALGAFGAGGSRGAGTASVILDSGLSLATTFGLGGAGGVPAATQNGLNGAVNTGYGGKGAGAGGSIGADGGAGGSGLVVVRYNPTPITINSLSLSGGGALAAFRSTTTLVANTDSPASVTFYANGKKLAGCISLLTTGASPNIVATCAWKPATRGSIAISATAKPTVPQFNGETSSQLRVSIQNRTGAR